MFLDDTGIVLKTVRYDDTSSVVHIFTRSHGTVPFLVTRPRNRASSNASIASLMTPMGFLSFQWNKKPTQTLYRLRDVHAAQVWQALPYHPVKRAIVLMLTESLAAMLREEGENVPLFDDITRALCWLDEAEEGYANFHLVFLLRVARALGVAPYTDSFATGHSFDIESALFVPYATASPLVMTPPDAEIFYRLSQADYPLMASIRMAHNDRTRLLTYLNRFFILHLPAFPELKSLDILESLFND